MKKVRYIIGAAGALAMTPAIGALTPAAQAATAQTAAPHSGKTVSLNRNTALAAIGCPGQSPTVRKAHSGTGVNKFSVSALGDFAQLTGCLGSTYATLHHRQAGLRLRIRTYVNGVQKTWPLTTGLESGGTTYFFRTLNTPADKVCDALVRSTSPNIVEYGPVCINL
jgi:hypothetical protein